MSRLTIKFSAGGVNPFGSQCVLAEEIRANSSSFAKASPFAKATEDGRSLLRLWRGMPGKLEDLNGKPRGFARVGEEIRGDVAIIGMRRQLCP